MFKILKESKYELIEKKSKFITRIKFIDSEKSALSIIKEITLMEKGAVHNCYAFRIVKDDKSILERKSDDGEPGGTAGAPMLAVLGGNNMVNVLAVTTRYFGGIKLGTGGLVNVYKKGVNEALKLCDREEYKICNKYKLFFPINETDHCLYLLKRESINIISKEFGNDVVFNIEVSSDNMDKLGEICKTIKGRMEEI